MWLAGSPRVQRLAAVPIAVVLLTGIAGAVARHGRVAVDEPLALATAVGPVVAAQASSPAARPARPETSRTRARQRPTPHSRRAPRGWDFWSVRIRGCESYGRPDAGPDYRAKNPGSTASGAYQIVDTTWAGRFGVAHAVDASPDQQEQVAAELYRRHGTADWAASSTCWRLSRALLIRSATAS